MKPLGKTAVVSPQQGVGANLRGIRERVKKVEESIENGGKKMQELVDLIVELNGKVNALEEREQEKVKEMELKIDGLNEKVQELEKRETERIAEIMEKENELNRMGDYVKQCESHYENISAELVKTCIFLCVLEANKPSVM